MNYTIHSSLIWVWVLGVVLMGCGDGTIEVISYNVKASFGDSDRAMHQAERVAAVMNAVRPPNTPDIILLQEIESRQQVYDIANEYLVGRGYVDMAITEPVGIDLRLAIISRYPIEDVRCHTAYRPGMPPLRCVLEAQIAIGGGVLFVLNAHLKSKREGAAETEYMRIATAEAIHRRIETILADDAEAHIVIAGDFNESAHEYAQVEEQYYTALMPLGVPIDDEWFKPLLVSEEHQSESWVDMRAVLYSPWGDATHDGSYYFRGRWEQIDHFLLSAPLLTSEWLQYHNFEVATGSDLLIDGYPNAEYSDHLPIMLTLSGVK